MKKYLILAIVVILVIVVVAVWLILKFFGAQDPDGPSPYSAVYMATGDIYYGKLSWFPRPKLSEVWFLQRGVDPQSGQAQFGLTRFDTAFWGPVDEMYLNSEQILFWTHLRNSSQVARAFANPSLLQQGGPPAVTPTGQPSSQFQGPSEPPPSEQ